MMSPLCPQCATQDDTFLSSISADARVDCFRCGTCGHGWRRTEGRDSELRRLFHRLNNELAIILANAELLEAKVRNDIPRARAAQVVASVLDAKATAMEIRQSMAGQS